MHYNSMYLDCACALGTGAGPDDGKLAAEVESRALQHGGRGGGRTCGEGAPRESLPALGCDGCPREAGCTLLPTPRAEGS
jgi:hypothetical protein